MNRPTTIRYKTPDEYQEETNALGAQLAAICAENRQKELECSEAEALVQSVLTQNINYLKDQIEVEKKYNDLKVEYELERAKNEKLSAQVEKLNAELAESNELAHKRKKGLIASKSTTRTVNKIRRVYEHTLMKSMQDMRLELVNTYDIKISDYAERRRFRRVVKKSDGGDCEGSQPSEDDKNTTVDDSSQTMLDTREFPTTDIDIIDHDFDDNCIQLHNHACESFDLLGCHFVSTLAGKVMINYTFERSVLVEPRASALLWSETSMSRSKRHNPPYDYILMNSGCSFMEKALNLYPTYEEMLGLLSSEGSNCVVDTLKDSNDKVIATSTFVVKPGHVTSLVD